MDVLSFIVALIALLIAVMAFRRTGGIDEIRADLEAATEALGRRAHAAREKTADLLEHLEDKVRDSDEEQAPTERH